MRNGIIVAAVHVLLALGTAGKYLYERETLPRVWARSVPFDPFMPIRGRYVNLTIEVHPVDLQRDWSPAAIFVADGKLMARAAVDGFTVMKRGTGWVLLPALAFFLPEHVPDPSQRAAGEELWVEVSVPPKGPPRPVRLGVKRGDGPIEPIL